MTPRLHRTADTPLGQTLAEAEGRIGDRPFVVTLTEHQLHFRVKGGPSYAVDLKALTEGAMTAIAADLEGGP